MKQQKKLLFILSLAWMVLASAQLRAEDTLIDALATSWKYLDNGSNQGTAWREENFNDSGWSSGLAQLGYGDGDEATVVNSGPANNYYITTYFRHTFSVIDPAAYWILHMDLLRDDGVVVYLNGVEVLRNNMPAGNITYNTLASSGISGGGENNPVSSNIPVSSIHAGNNTIAVEIHQSSASSADITFALQLFGYPVPIPVDRGSYLQMITPDSAIIRWQTATASNSQVNFGIDAGNLSNAISDNTVSFQHEILLDGLNPDTTYYYNVGSTSAVWSSGSDHFFKTQPNVGSASPTRIWVIGDSGTGSQEQKDVFSGYQKYTGSTYTDLWLMLGDNAYTNGTDAEYQAGFFTIYPSLLHQTVVWPTLGNHDGYSVDTPTGTGPYYDIFTLPKDDKMGGYPSGTESYYSYNYGNIHFIVLDSFDMDRSITASMAEWLENDLTDTENDASADWIIAYWHHPPYSNGSHNSDSSDGHDGSSTGIDSFNAMIQMRENILPILEQHGVDLVLTGHSHSYERTKFIKGHYDFSSTYSDALHALNIGSGDIHTGAMAYSKNHPATPLGGTVYAVAGTSARADGVDPFPMMYRSLNQIGSMVIDIHHLSLSARFINDKGVILDAFTIQKLITGTDQDGDGIANSSDNCPLIANQNQMNADGDSFGNFCDSDWLDTDLDDIGNDADWDDDGDGAPDVVDAEPLNGNSYAEIPLPLAATYKGNLLKSTKNISP